MAVAQPPARGPAFDSYPSQEQVTTGAEPLPPEVVVAVVLAILGGAIGYVLTSGRALVGFSAVTFELALSAAALIPVISLFIDATRMLREARRARSDGANRRDGPPNGCSDKQKDVHEAVLELDELLSERENQPWLLLTEGGTIILVAVGGFAWLSSGTLNVILIVAELAIIIGTAGYFGIKLANLDRRIRSASVWARRSIRVFDDCLQTYGKKRIPATKLRMPISDRDREKRPQF